MNRSRRRFSEEHPRSARARWLLTRLITLHRSLLWSPCARKRPRISLSLLLSNRAVSFVQSAPRACWCLSGDVGGKHVGIPNTQLCIATIFAIGILTCLILCIGAFALLVYLMTLAL
jgi:hypothetical protein